MKTLLLSLALLLGVTIPASAGDIKFRYGQFRPTPPPVVYPRRPYYGRYYAPRRPGYYNWHHGPGAPGAAPYSGRFGRNPYGGYQRFGVIPPVDRGRSPYLYYGWEFEF